MTPDHFISPLSLSLTQGCIIIIALCDSHTAPLKANARWQLFLCEGPWALVAAGGLFLALLYCRHQPFNGIEPEPVMLRLGQLLHTAARATFAINNEVRSRHGWKDEAESGVFKVDFASVYMSYNTRIAISRKYFFVVYVSFTQEECFQSNQNWKPALNWKSSPSRWHVEPGVWMHY